MIHLGEFKHLRYQSRIRVAIKRRDGVCCATTLILHHGAEPIKEHSSLRWPLSRRIGGTGTKARHTTLPAEFIAIPQMHVTDNAPRSDDEFANGWPRFIHANAPFKTRHNFAVNFERVFCHDLQLASYVRER